MTFTGAITDRAAGVLLASAGFGEWFAAGPKDVGNQTRAVLSARDKSGAAMQSTARRLTGPTGGNGPLMRTAAVGLAFLDDEEACLDAALALWRCRPPVTVETTSRDGPRSAGWTTRVGAPTVRRFSTRTTPGSISAGTTRH